MKKATLNVNNQLANMLDWLGQSRPDVAAFRSSRRSILVSRQADQAGYDGMAWAEVMERGGDSGAGIESPILIHSELSRRSQIQLAVHSGLELPLLPCNH